MTEPILESLLLLVVGMFGVFTSLVLLAGMIWLFRFADEHLNMLRIRLYSKKVESQHEEDEINDQLVAVLSAAAITALRRPVIVRKMRFLGTAGTPAWAVTGRLNVMASHAIPKRKS